MQYFWAALITLWLVIAVYFYINYVIFHKYFGKAGRRKKSGPQSGAGEYERINITAADEIILTAKLYIPESGDGEKSVLLSHGYRTSGEADFEKEAELYKSLGYNVLVMEHRCHGKSSGDIVSMGIIESYDVVYWCKWLELRFGTGCPTIVHGKGMGGFAAVVALANPELPRNVAKAVAENVYDSVFNLFSETMQSKYGFWSKVIIPVVNIFYRLNTGFDMRDAELKRFAKKISTPVLFINTDKSSQAVSLTKTAVCDVELEKYLED